LDNSKPYFGGGAKKLEDKKGRTRYVTRQTAKKLL